MGTTPYSERSAIWNLRVSSDDRRRVYGVKYRNIHIFLAPDGVR